MVKHRLLVCVLTFCSVVKVIDAQIGGGVNSGLLVLEGRTVADRFAVPVGFKRVPYTPGSYANYLRTLVLMPSGSQVHYFDGRIKSADGVYVAVVDLDVGTRDLQQCADAIMRLRGEYLFSQGAYDDIHFNFLSDGMPRFFRVYAQGDYSHRKFRRYMDYVFAFANTSSLYDEMVGVDCVEAIACGDVFIQKGRPFGHAVIVVDVAENLSTGKKLFLLAQSYMPAQEIQILINPSNMAISPWYEAESGVVVTPEWTFEAGDLRRFK